MVPPREVRAVGGDDVQINLRRICSSRCVVVDRRLGEKANDVESRRGVPSTTEAENGDKEHCGWLNFPSRLGDDVRFATPTGHLLLDRRAASEKPMVHTHRNLLGGRRRTGGGQF